MQLFLYHSPLCVYCLHVLLALARLSVKVNTRNVLFNQRFADELIEQGGRFQVPCLRIETGDDAQWLYESDAIIEYLRRLDQARATP